MTASKRLAIDPAKFIRPNLVEIRGVKVEVSVSPYDIPDHVSGDYDKNAKRFVIRFHYPVDDEPLTAVEHAKNVHFHIGKHSQRLYEVVLDVDAMNVSAVELKLQVQRAVEAFAREPRHARSENYRIANEVIDEQGTEMFEPVTAG